MWKSEKKLEGEKEQAIKNLTDENNRLRVALKRIADTYDNIEDLAGVIAREALETNKD